MLHFVLKYLIFKILAILTHYPEIIYHLVEEIYNPVVVVGDGLIWPLQAVIICMTFCILNNSLILILFVVY